jgi:hypothetical protein
MKKRRTIKAGYITVIVILIIVASPFIIWRAKPERTLNVIIIDKTVPDTTYREHKGFMWILNNLKIKNGKLDTAFKYDKNYYGFIPLGNEKYTTKELPENIGKQDLIYITDTYGVYNEDFYSDNLEGNRSKIIYGGTKGSEIGSIQKVLNNNTIIGEFNTLASPTDDSARKELENIFGLKWNNWIGRYFSDLSHENVEIPNWMKENYAMMHGEKWNFSGAGIVLVNSDDTIIVLRKGVELSKGLNKINFEVNAKNEFQVKNNIKYYYWFEITTADENTEIIAKYKLDVTEKGQMMLDEYKLPATFPAIVRKIGAYTSYYFAGDFADSNSTPGIYSASGIQLLNKITTFDEDASQNYFYWNVYYPLIKNIVKNIN